MSLKQVLARHGVHPDKRYGQHFLVSEGTVSKIVSRVDQCLGVLEIGPGPGVLSGPLSFRRKVIVVEVDEAILPVLREMAPDVEIVVGDALQTDLSILLDRLPVPRALVSNMPYNITGPLLEAFAKVRAQYSVAVLMMQREVAEKILSKPGDRHRGALSVVMQAMYQIEKVCSVPPGSFLPPPKIDSTVLQFTPHTTTEGTEDVFELVRTGFTQPRKTLANNLRETKFNESVARIAGSGLSPTVRPHELTWEQWLALKN